jgi:Flp pilus assembly protein TadG
MKNSLVARVRRFVVSDSEGGALVEMAVTVPLVFLIMTGIFSFSTCLYQKIQLAEAVSNAGHYLAVARGDHDPCATATNSILNGSPGLSTSLLTVTLSQNGTTLPASCPGSGTNGASSTLIQGANVQVNATYQTGLAVYGTPYSSINLGSQITEVVQ